MADDFKFLKPGRLADGDLRLVLVKKHPADPKNRLVPWYQFDMRRVGTDAEMGRITLRVGSVRALRCPGHIGYKVNKRYRGHRYAARACRLLLPLAAAHGFSAVWVTCDPKNKASARTLEIAGGRYTDTVRVPKTHNIYTLGGHYRRRYRIDLRRALAK